MAKRKKKRKSKQKIALDKNKLYLFIIAVLLLFVAYFNIDKLGLLFKDSNQSKIGVKTMIEHRTVLDAITYAKRLLGVPDKNFSTVIGETAIHISIGIDRAEMDLNYANMIISGQIELVNGFVSSGREKQNGNKQVMEIHDEDDLQKYVIVLHYVNNQEEEKKKTKIAIVVDDFGIHNDKLLEKFCALDRRITFAILPDQRYSQQVMQMAKNSGHETMIHIPMEPVSYPRNNPGPEAIYVHLTEREIRKRMEKMIKQFPDCIGANNHMGSLVTTDERVMQIVLEVLKKHDLFFVDSRTSNSTIAYEVAKKMMIPTFKSNLFLDTPDVSLKTMKSKLNTLKSLGKTRDKMLVITHCATQERYEYLKEFIKRIEKLDFEIVPASELFENNLPEIL